VQEPAAAAMLRLATAAVAVTFKPAMPAGLAPPSRPAMVVLAVMAVRPLVVSVVPPPAVLVVLARAALAGPAPPPAGAPLAVRAALLLIRRSDVVARLGRA
jgi:hypothetical protein